MPVDLVALLREVGHFDADPNDVLEPLIGCTEDSLMELVVAAQPMLVKASGEFTGMLPVSTRKKIERMLETPGAGEWLVNSLSGALVWGLTIGATAGREKLLEDNDGA